ncbi:MAG: NAD(P)H-hydrate dehydratase [Lewinellaceae bacterium]|nr:NAD(P)H-hydrate dehydratase [Lewinellaceae bacterium]
MKIFSASQVRAWDRYTIATEPIASIDLMNRAARVFTDWLVKTYPDPTRPVVVYAGTGNNGGDGVAVARMLDQAQYAAKVAVCDFGGRHSDDFEAQLGFLTPFSTVQPITFKSFDALKAHAEHFSTPNDLVIDALFGTGLTRPLEGEWAALVAFLHSHAPEIVSIDVPSGMFCDEPTPGSCVVFTFQAPKRAFFFPENAEYLGNWTFQGIGLHPGFEKETDTPYHYITMADVVALRKPRPLFSHKGTYGHALLIAGSWGKMGAAVLATRACLRSGVGLLTVHVPRCGQIILQSTVPEAMVSADRRAKFWAEAPDVAGFSSIGIGPGIGRAMETAKALKALLQKVTVPLVLDADALNLIAETPDLLDQLPENTIITPHPKEFERLFGKTASAFQRNELQREMAQKHGIFIILKGAYTAIACPDGECWYNSTGNPGMATGGTGDVLTGLLTGLLSQGYTGKSAWLLGVFLHGLAGDVAAAELGQEALVAGDVIANMGKAWTKLHL